MVDFDEQLLQRLQAFQQANGLTATGKVDPSTWHTLVHTKPILSDDGQYRWDGSAWHPTALTRTPAGLPQSKTVSGFGKDCAELRQEQKDALREVAAELAAHPLGHDGYVLVVGTATTADLAKRLAEAAGDFLRTLLKAEERVDVRTLVEPKGKPTVEVTIHRREWQHKPAPKLEMPTKKVPTIDLDKLGPQKPDVLKPLPIKWRPDVVVSNAFLRICIEKPVPKNILDDLSVLRDKELDAPDTAKVAGCIARVARLTTAEETTLGNVLRKKLKEAAKEAIKNLIEQILAAVVKEPVEKPLEPHGPSKLPEKPDGIIVFEFTF